MRRWCFKQGRLHVHKATLRSSLHSFFERFRHPRIVMFHDILRHLCPFVCRQTLELFNDFCRIHGLIISRSSFLASQAIACQAQIIVRVFPGGQMAAPAPFCEGGIGHALLERFRNPRIILLRDKFGHLRPFVGGQALDLLDDFCRTHNLISCQNHGKVKRVKSCCAPRAFSK